MRPPSAPDPSWQLWIDTGGTFTDCLARAPDGELHRAKVLSSSALRGTVREVLDARTLRVDTDWTAPPDGLRGFAFRLLGAEEERGIAVAGWDPSERVLRLAAPAAGAEPGAACELRSPEEAPILAARLVTGTPAGAALPAIRMRLATTRGTNALLERQGAPTALFVTRGWADLLRIGTQQRPDLFALEVRRPEPLPCAVVEVPERLAAGGAVLESVDRAAVLAEARRLAAEGVQTAAVALLHAFRNPAHEREVCALLREAGFVHVSASAELAPFIGLLARAETAAADAYLSPVIDGYLAGVRGALGGGSLHVMTSAGGLVRPDAFRPKDGLLSGPAGGVLGAARAGRLAGRERVIAFDMGGTSTDVARVDGDPEYVWEHRVGDARLLAPALAIESVAAGGGSVCGVDANGLFVGPRSAGADPGPACYGAGGPLTVTDVNLLLGRLDPARFAVPVRAAAAERALDALRAALRERDGEELGRESLLAGLLEIADERMADAIRAVSVRRGYDPAEYALVAFGGAGPQHGCGVAARLGIGTVIVPPDAGLLSALGIGHAAVERFAERQLLRPLADVTAELPALLAALEAEARTAVAAEGVPPGAVEIRRRIAELRYRGQESALAVDIADPAALREGWERRYEEVYGNRADRPSELVSLRVVASARAEAEPEPPSPEPYEPDAEGSARVWLAGGWRRVPAWERSELRAGARFRGPALVRERHSATVVEPGWSARVCGSGALLLTADGAPADATAPRPAAVTEELFTHRFTALVGEMGEQLRRTAVSVNVKERLDFSCALLDPDGRLVVNAPHIPVHLGALGECVRRVRDALPLGPGDVAVTNHPAFGGSHLPDVTTITPVLGAGDTLLGYVASRAHHAEIGGTRPGSMPPGARSLAEEGIVIPPLYLVRAGGARWEAVRRLLAGGPHPSRAPDENLADLAAAVAAGRRGAALLRALAEAHGADAIRQQMRALQRRAERRVREALARLPDGEYAATERLDDDSPLAVRVTVRGDEATIDFAGSAPVHPGNLNATPAIVRSVVLYVLRLLVREPLPLNEGLLAAVELRIPPGLLNPPFSADPRECPAVVGGNTEVSQRLVDTLLRALGLAAGSQGTMNNTLWGTDRFGFYETVCGGTGAGPGWDGASAVHSHMTNTRITDPEIIEMRYPVRVERFAVRRGSGGAGRWRGGDGATREMTFLEPMQLSLLTQHRAEGPYGMRGGDAGEPGRQRVVRDSGEVVELGAVDGCEVEPGDRLVLETPGGGGWGEAGVGLRFPSVL